jgi:hypothetical protein
LRQKRSPPQERANPKAGRTVELSEQNGSVYRQDIHEANFRKSQGPALVLRVIFPDFLRHPSASQKQRKIKDRPCILTAKKPAKNELKRGAVYSHKRFIILSKATAEEKKAVRATTKNLRIDAIRRSNL